MTPTTPEVDHRYLTLLQAQMLDLAGSVLAAIERADLNSAKAHAAAEARDNIEEGERDLIEAARAGLDALSDSDPTAGSAALAQVVFSHVLTSALGWTPDTPEECLDVLAAQRERVSAINAEARRSAQALGVAVAAAAAARIRRNAVLRALAVGVDPDMTVEAYRTVLQEIVHGEPAP